MSTEISEGIPLIRAFKSELIPLDRLNPSEELMSLLERIIVTDYNEYLTATGGSFEIELSVAPEAVVAMPGLDGFAFVFGGEAALLNVRYSAEPTTSQVAVGGGFRIRFPQDWLVPVIQQDGQWVPDPAHTHAQLAIAAGVLIDQDWNVTFDGSNAFTLAPAMISNSGFVIEGELALDLSENHSLSETRAMGLGESWRGAIFNNLTLHLPSNLDVPILPSDLTLTNFHIGSGGLSGAIAGNWTPTVTGNRITGNGAGTLFGIDFGLKQIQIDLLQNSLTGLDMRGLLGLPFFDDVLDVELGLDLDGQFSVVVDSANGIADLSIPNVLDFQVESLSLEYEDGGTSVGIGGQVTPTFGGLEWPTFDIKKLSIDCEGNVKLDGGWLDLPEQYSFSFYGFQLEISKLGFGKTDDGGKWVGFSGGLKLVDGLSAGASVEGLRIIWYEDGRDTKISLNGVGVEMLIPDVLSFKGEVAFRQLVDKDGAQVNRFDGAIKLELMTLGLEIDAVLVVGSAEDLVQGQYTFLAIYLGVELPAGIPLWATGMALYGMSGLFALNLKPNKQDNEPWYGLAPGEGWYKRPEIGVTDLKSKWENERGSLAIGGGITLGTLPDNGYTFSGKMLLVIVFPGPIVLLEGKANLLKQRAKLDEEPLFRALAVLDGRERTFLFGLDAQYKYDSGGKLIDIGGGAEAFFDFDDPSKWHLYLGQNEPDKRRIRAKFLSLFEANAYFMIDAHKLQMGAWVGYDKRWKFGPLKVTLEAWIEGNAVMSWRPTHFYGDLSLHGKAELSVFGFGLGLSVDANIAADVFDPFHILGEFSVGINLPWPLPDFDVDITLEWGPEPEPPLLPKPLQSVSVEHFKVTTKWPLPAGQLLQPPYDSNGDGLLDGSTNNTIRPTGNKQPDLNRLPVVPLDARPHLTFGRSVHDDALISVNPQSPTPHRERIGDPEKNEGPVLVRYGLKEVVLEKRVGGTWQTVARKGDTPNPAGVPRLFGSWAPMPSLPLPEDFDSSTDVHVNQTKLWLWSRTPYSYTRHTSDDLANWFEDAFGQYPCVPDVPDRIVCCDFDDLPLGRPIRSSFTCRTHDFIHFQATQRGGFNVEYLEPAIDGHRRAICATTGQGINIILREPSDEVTITATVAPAPPAELVCVDFRDSGGTPQFPNPHQTRQKVQLRGLDANGRLENDLFVVNFDTTSGMMVNYQLHIRLPCPSAFTEVTVSSFSSPAEVVALNDRRQVVDTVPNVGGDGQEQTVRLSGERIVHVVVVAPNAQTLFHAICFECAELPKAIWNAVGFGGGVIFPAGSTSGTTLTVRGTEMTHIRVTGTTHLCLVAVCVNIGPDPDEVQRRIEMGDHIASELARWQDQGYVLESNTRYRLKVVTTVDAQGDGDFKKYSRDFTMTEFAYFQTAGAPGVTTLSTPIDHPNANEFQAGQGGLGDLTLYVDQTIPPTVPQQLGEKALLPRPVYRAYDVGVRFNEDYVDLMYRQNGRDLGIYLFDNNNQPVRDRFGRLVTLSNAWGVTEDVALDGAELRFVGQINASGCLSDVDFSLVPRKQAIAAQQLLDPDTVYEARLIPLLLHDDFSQYAQGTVVSNRLGAWQVIDEGNQQTPSRWEVGKSGTPATPHIVQTSNIWGSSRGELRKSGTLLMRGDNAWTDYRITLFVRSADNDAVGVVFRYRKANTFYRFSMDKERAYRRLVCVHGGSSTLLAEDSFAYERNRDYRLAIEAIGHDLRVYQDGVLVFAVTDDRIASGRIGLYSWGNQGTQFKDVRVHDFRLEAPVVYRFRFTTSLFTNFFHQLHSYEDDTWLVEINGAATEVSHALNEAVTPSSAPPQEAESRAYAELANLAIGSAAMQEPTAVEISRVVHDGTPIAFLLRSPEPLDWSRTDITLSYAETIMRPAVPPSDLKITDVTFGANQAVQLLARTSVNLLGYQLQYERWPTPRDQVALNMLFRDRFAEGDFSAWTVVDHGDGSAPSNWSIVDGVLRQTSNIYSLPLNRDAPEKAGTVALVGDGTWRDVILDTGVQVFDNDAVGVVFRYQDSDNFYRFSMDHERRYRRVVKNVDGTMTVLWEDDVPYEIRRHYTLTIVAIGGSLRGYLDERLIFDVIDFDLPTGQCGLYCWANDHVRFDHLWVDSAESRRYPTLLKDSFNVKKPNLWTFVAESARTEPSAWQADGVLRPYANAHPLANAADTALYALAGDVAWRDYRLTTSLRVTSATDEAVGVLFRYQDDDNYYRLTMSQHRPFRLERKQAGTLTMLEQTNDMIQRDRTYQLTVECLGTQLSAFLNGVPLFALQDTSLTTGRIALVSGANTDAQFGEVEVVAPSWALYHAFAHDGVLPAGTQVDVVKERGDTVETPYHIRLFSPAAPVLSTPSRLRLNSNGHSNTFLAATEYLDVTPIGLLGKADGTAFFLLPPAPQQGTYRLSFTYRRDNSAQDSSSLLLRQAGNSDDETVEITIPWLNTNS